MAKIESPHLPALCKIALLAAPKKSIRPVLSHVYLSGGKDGKTIATGTDLDILLTAMAPGDSFGICLLPNAVAQSIAKDKAKECSVAGDLVCYSGLTTKTEDFANYPSKGVGEEKGDVFEVRMMLGSLERTAEAAAIATDNEGSRYALWSLLIDGKDTLCHIVGTDGRRLHAFVVDADFTRKKPFEILVPPRAIKLFSKAVREMEQSFGVKGKRLNDSIEMTQITAYVSENLVRFEYESNGACVQCYTRKVEGRFPRWRDVFPDKPEAAAVLMADEFPEQLKLAARATDEQHKGVKIQPGQLSSKGLSGEFSCILAGDVREDYRVNLDHRYIFDAMKALEIVNGKQQHVLIYGKDWKSAAVFKHNEAHPTQGVVVMPLSCEEWDKEEEKKQEEAPVGGKA